MTTNLKELAEAVTKLPVEERAFLAGQPLPASMTLNSKKVGLKKRNAAAMKFALAV